MDLVLIGYARLSRSYFQIKNLLNSYRAGAHCNLITLDVSALFSERFKNAPRNRHLKGQCHEIFRFMFFSWITFTQSTDNNIKIISKLFENSRRYSQVKVHHQCQRHWRQICHQYQGHRRQILPPVPLVLLTPVTNNRNNIRLQTPESELKAKIYIFVSSTTQRWPNKIIKIFLIEDFFHLPPVSLTPVANLKLRISPRIFERIQNGLNGILWGWGETDSRKEPEAKNLVTLSL